jgi:hypothetical protein
VANGEEVDAKAAQPTANRPASSGRRRPRWRLAVGGVSTGAGLILLGFGTTALAAQGLCGSNPFEPLSTCDNVLPPNPVGGTLVGVGAALSVGGLLMMAIPGR